MTNLRLLTHEQAIWTSDDQVMFKSWTSYFDTLSIWTYNTYTVPYQSVPTNTLEALVWFIYEHHHLTFYLLKSPILFLPSQLPHSNMQASLELKWAYEAQFGIIFADFMFKKYQTYT